MWVFGYGSLMWDGGEVEFGAARRERATLSGVRREFNKASWKNWGTRAVPAPTLGLVEEERAQFHCPHCDAEISGITGQDFPEHHAYVTYETFGCGRVTADGREESPCPYGPNWPNLEEFEFVVREQGGLFVCCPMPKTDRARRVRATTGEVGRTKEEAEENARIGVAPKV